MSRTDMEKNNPVPMMATLKRRINENTGEQEELELTFFKQSLRYLSTASGRQVDLQPWTISTWDVEFGEAIGGGGL